MDIKTCVQYWPGEAVVGPRPTAEEVQQFNAKARANDAHAARWRRQQGMYTNRWFCKTALRRKEFRAALAYGLRALADWID